jgi:4-diphosphocytidyl-2C-methyl-D-erythritol kinase
VAALRSGDFRALKDQVHNDLEESAGQLSPWVHRLREAFAAEDCVAAGMSGSGTGYFGICCHARHARRVAARMQARGLGLVYTVTTSIN